jgi:hypothetical protein
MRKREKVLRILAAGVAVVLALLVLAGCGGGELTFDYDGDIFADAFSRQEYGPKHGFIAPSHFINADFLAGTMYIGTQNAVDGSVTRYKYTNFSTQRDAVPYSAEGKTISIQSPLLDDAALYPVADEADFNSIFDIVGDLPLRTDEKSNGAVGTIIVEVYEDNFRDKYEIRADNIVVLRKYRDTLLIYKEEHMLTDASHFLKLAIIGIKYSTGGVKLHTLLPMLQAAEFSGADASDYTLCLTSLLRHADLNYEQAVQFREMLFANSPLDTMETYFNYAEPLDDASICIMERGIDYASWLPVDAIYITPQGRLVVILTSFCPEYAISSYFSVCKTTVVMVSAYYAVDFNAVYDMLEI